MVIDIHSYPSINDENLCYRNTNYQSNQIMKKKYLIQPFIIYIKLVINITYCLLYI